MTRRVVCAGLGGLAALALWRAAPVPWFELGAGLVAGCAAVALRRRASAAARVDTAARFVSPAVAVAAPWAPTQIGAPLFPAALGSGISPPPPVSVPMMDSVARRAAMASAAAVANITISSVSPPIATPRVPASLPTCPRCRASIHWDAATHTWRCAACGPSA